MEPRCRSPFAGGTSRYVGGVGDYDLYVDTDMDIRVVPIERPYDWGYLHIREGKVCDRVAMPTCVTAERDALIRQYVRLFVPGILVED